MLGKIRINSRSNVLSAAQRSLLRKLTMEVLHETMTLHYAPIAEQNSMRNIL